MQDGFMLIRHNSAIPVFILTETPLPSNGQWQQLWPSSPQVYPNTSRAPGGPSFCLLGNACNFVKGMPSSSRIPRVSDAAVLPQLGLWQCVGFLSHVDACKESLGIAFIW